MRAARGLVVLLAGCVTTVQGTYPGDRPMWDGIFTHAERIELPARPVAVVAPHHLIDASELAGFWSELAKQKPSVVVVIGPDHHAHGAGVTVGQGVTYDTVYGPLRTDAGLARALRSPRRDAAFVGEHALHVHAPFIRRLLPEARFVPVMFQWAVPRAELEALARRLDQLLPPDALVVASVDFSHYQPAPWATFHDESSFSTVSGFDLDALFLREVDSPESLFVAMRFAQLRGAAKATRLLHTNSQRRRSVLITDSTSHQYFTFTAGTPVPRPSASVAITGDVAASTGLTLHEGWTWHPDHDSGAPKYEGLRNIRGQEDRFFMGPQATLFGLAPGQQVRRMQNGLDVLYAAVDLSQPVPSLAGDCVIVLASGGTAEAARALLQQGAHVVVGRGFGPSLPLEHLDGRVLALSLGPFLSGEEGEGQVLGVTCTKEGVRTRTVPIRVTKGLPALDRERLGAELELPLTFD
ncbi:MAG: AmmeMemoRadiSam system protein B [Archangium sp.]|nr:AmmeMemoRadiSam system protein B [Archangium sp.]